VQNIAIIENPPAFKITYFPIGYPFIGVVTSSKITLIKKQNYSATHSYICGQAMTNFNMSLPTIERYLAIQFHPWSLQQFFKYHALDFYDEQIPLDLVDKHLADQLHELMNSPLSSELVLKQVQLILMSRLKLSSIDKRIKSTLGLILASEGNMSTRRLSDSINLSKRRLEQLFSKNVGISPKKYSRVVRFQNILFNHLLSNNDNIEVPSGFFDQAHFIHEIKKLSGMTPNELKEHLKDDINRMTALEANLYIRYMSFNVQIRK